MNKRKHESNKETDLNCSPYSHHKWNPVGEGKNPSLYSPDNQNHRNQKRKKWVVHQQLVQEFYSLTHIENSPPSSDHFKNSKIQPELLVHGPEFPEKKNGVLAWQWEEENFQKLNTWWDTEKAEKSAVSRKDQEI